MFDNLKIAITDEVQFEAVCDVLESMGFTNNQFGFDINNHREKNKFKSISCYESGLFYYHKMDVDMICFCDLVTLTDLLAMRDKKIKEKIGA